MIQTRRIFVATGLAASVFPLETLRAQTPAVAKPDDGFTVLEAKPGEVRLRGANEPATSILGYNGQFPGPLLRIKKGEELKLRLVNGLKQPTSLHMRGMRGPNALDGVAPLTQAPVAPGQSFDYRFTPPDSGLFCFHPHGPNAAEQAGRGLGGILIVEEDKPPQVDHEFMFALSDWQLDDKGGLREPMILPADSAGAGRLGPLMTINGAPAPFLQEAAPGARIRLRVVNMCMAQITALTFEGAMPMIAAIDSQPCNAFEPVARTFPIGPGARFDVLFDMPDAEKQSAKIVLRRWPLQGKPDTQPQDVAIFTAKGARRPALPPIASLPDNTSLPPIIQLQNAKRLDLTIASMKTAKPDPKRLWTFNGAPMDIDPARPLFSVKRGTPLTLGFINTSTVPHVMRLHGHVFRQLHLLDDGWEPYWRDSVIVPEGKTVRVAILADNPGKWRLGSGILAHGESGLSSWIEVT